MTNDESIIQDMIREALNKAWYKLREPQLDLKTICLQLKQTAELCLAELEKETTAPEGARP